MRGRAAGAHTPSTCSCKFTDLFLWLNSREVRKNQNFTGRYSFTRTKKELVPKESPAHGGRPYLKRSISSCGLMKMQTKGWVSPFAPLEALVADTLIVDSLPAQMVSCAAHTRSN
jgi:hypothetical protein